MKNNLNIVLVSDRYYDYEPEIQNIRTNTSMFKF